jgi:hypothetical protein
MKPRCAVLLFALMLPSLACIRPKTCGARGAQTSLAGVVSYAIGGHPGHTLSETLEVDDYIESCTYDDEEFPVKLDDCTLWAKLEHGPEPAGRFFPGNPSGWAAIESGQTCALPLAGGTATVTIDSGTIAFATSTTGLFLSGAVTGWVRGDGATGPLEWQFQSGQWPL